MTWRGAGLLVLACLAWGCASQRGAREGEAVTEALVCGLSVPPRVQVGGAVPVHFRLTNRSGQTLWLLTWRTPLEGVRGNDFRITREGEELPYQGPMVKRGAPGAQDYVPLAPGASTDAEVDLAQAYGLQQPGRYRIAWRGPLLDVTDRQAEVPRPLERHRALAVQCPEVEVELVTP